MKVQIICDVSGIYSKLCFFKDFSFAYYVYCLACKLQLALVVVFTEVKLVHQFFLYCI
jgi:hypothetical protein